MKKFIAGVAVGALVTSATAVVAAGPEQIVAYLRSDFSVELNGKKAELDNSPAIIDGSMYLPLKEVAGLVGVDVAWNEETQTAELRSDATAAPSAKPTSKPAEVNKHVAIKQIVSQYDAYDFRFVNGQFDFIRFTTVPHATDKYETLFKNVPYTIIDDASHIEREFFEQNLLPLIKLTK